MAKLITRKGKETWSECVRKNGGKLDKMALDILELHQEDHLSCVALCALKKGGYLIATNGFVPDTEACAEQFKCDFIYLSQSHLSDMHAEMKLLSTVVNEGLKPLQNEIGVSKPCCALCASVLDSFKMKYTLWHKEATFWLSPYPCTKTILISGQEYYNTGDAETQNDDYGIPHLILQYPAKDLSGKPTIQKIYDASGYVE